MITKDRVLQALKNHIGKANGISAGNLVYKIIGEYSDAEERSIRRIMVELRLDGAHICAHPATGYFMAETAEELDTTCEFLYERAMTTLRQVSAMRKVATPDLRGQLHLPT